MEGRLAVPLQETIALHGQSDPLLARSKPSGAASSTQRHQVPWLLWLEPGVSASSARSSRRCRPSSGEVRAPSGHPVTVAVQSQATQKDRAAAGCVVVLAPLDMLYHCFT